MESFKKHYKNTIVKNLQEKFGYKNPMQLPKLEKISINISDGAAATNNKIIANIMSELGAISGQKPAITKARKSNSAFKLREGMEIGCRVTLRGDRMYEFLERLVLVALPRIRDFRGFNTKQFDKKGNMSFGVKEQMIFPEINYDKIEKTRGMDITIVTTANTNEEGIELLKGFYIPFIN